MLSNLRLSSDGGRHVSFQVDKVSVSMTGATTSDSMQEYLDTLQNS